MGYDISVDIKDRETKQKMKDFLGANNDLLEKLKATESTRFYFSACESSELGYAPKKRGILGFHGTGIPYYAYSLCAWMSIKVGCKNKNGEHFLYYDKERMYISIEKEQGGRIVVDSDGVVMEKDRSASQKLAKLLGVGPDYVKQREILTELNARWTSLSLCNKPKIVTKKSLT